MKNKVEFTNQVQRVIFSITLMILVFMTSYTFCQSISVMPYDASCGNSDGSVDISITVLPPCTATTCVIMSLDRITPTYSNIVTGPLTKYLSFNVPNLSIGHYTVSVVVCGVTLNATFFIGDNSYWPVLPLTNNNYTRIFNKDLDTDNSKNVYTGGWYSGTFNFYPLNDITSNGFSSYVAKFNECGSGRWLNNIWSNDPVDCKINAISVTPSGDVVVVGDFNSSGPLTTYTINFSNSINRSFQGNNGGFIAKYNTAGICLWASLIKDGISTINLRDVAIDGQDNIFVLGDFDSDAIDIELFPILNSPITTIYNISNPVRSDVFLVAYDGSGNYIGSAD